MKECAHQKMPMLISDRQINGGFGFCGFLLSYLFRSILCIL